MRRPGIAIITVAVVAIALGFALSRAVRPPQAREHLSGIVLMVPSAGTVTVHHEPFAGMPAMSMTFAVPAGTAMRPGDRIDAAVDRSTDPWSLSDIHVSSGPAVARGGARLPFLAVGDRVPDTAFIDARGRRMTLAALRGAPYALTFIYTRCQDPRMCPFVSAKMHQVQIRTAGRHVALVEVSLDPAFDRPPVLARYGQAFGADPQRWHLLTGNPRTVLDFAARFRILERSAGPQTIVHTERLAVVDATGRIARFFDDATWRPEDVERALLAVPRLRSGRRMATSLGMTF